MNRQQVLDATYTKEEIQALVDEKVKMYWDGYGCPQSYETSTEKAMRVEQEERIDRENAMYERMGL